MSIVASLAAAALTGLHLAPASTPSAAPEADREAILAMAGAYRVTFRFEETVAMAPGYDLEAPYHSDAIELVEVIADEGDFISLQHILVVETGAPEPTIVKHWRQDWTFEDDDVLVYRGHMTWEHDRRSASEVTGTWTQAVHQTTDAPRYEATGSWVHRGDQSSWESEATWRPLPRRERRRTDYDVIACRNRHTITPTGWVHEQDNSKLDLDDHGAPIAEVAREMGVNTYERIGMDEVEAASSYWREHAPSWAQVREAWRPILARDRFTLSRYAEGTRLQAVVGEALENRTHLESLPDRLLAFIED